MKIIWFFIFIILSHTNGEEWEASNYPNPTTNGYRQCNMKSISFLCDPDNILKESERYRLNNELNMLESKTRQSQNDNFCSKKGIAGAIALAKHIRGGTENAAKTMANDMLQKWTLDSQCGKSLVIVIATEDRKFWVARDSRVPVYGTEFSELFNTQKNLFKQGNYAEAILNIIKGTSQKAISKYNTNDNEKPQSPSFKPSKPSKNEKTNYFNILSKIPITLWIILLLVVIPTLCCCGCIFFCCCRKNNTNKRQNINDENDNPELLKNNNQNRKNLFANLLSGVNIGAASAMLMNCIQKNKNNKKENNSNTNYNPGINQGKSEYKERVVEDSGGGGNW